jgi:hypothetical protein
MKCFYCNGEILENESTIYPLDNPYVNLRMHRVCARAVDLNFLQENYDKILEYIETYSANRTFIKTKRK